MGYCHEFDEEKLELIFQELLLRLTNKITQVTIRHQHTTILSKHLFYIKAGDVRTDSDSSSGCSINFLSNYCLRQCKIVYSVRIPLSPLSRLVAGLQDYHKLTMTI